MKRILPLCCSLLLLAVAVTGVFPGGGKADAQTGGSFSFGAAGDFASTSNTNGVLTAAKNAGLNFMLAVGDLSYDTQGSPAGWGNYVKGQIGTVPFEIIIGNHDASQKSAFEAALPNTMSNLQGTYAEQAYFDYPAASPLARIIMISPLDVGLDTNWLNTAIDSARSSGIKWVFVGLHENCITTGAKSCEIGQPLMDQLINKKVDVILQGHDHNYQRTKQLTCAKENTFQQSCVANNGPNFTRGAGSVLVINGAGGNSLYTVSSGDTEAGYFATTNSDTWGIAKFTVTANQIQEQFIKGAGGNLTDSFTITDNGTPNTSPGVTNAVNPTAGSGIAPTFVCAGSGLGQCTPTTAPTFSTGQNPTNPQPSSAGLQISVIPSTIPVSNSSNTGPLSTNPVGGISGGGSNSVMNIIQILLQLIFAIIMQFFGGGSGGHHHHHW